MDISCPEYGVMHAPEERWRDWSTGKGDTSVRSREKKIKASTGVMHIDCVGYSLY